MSSGTSRAIIETLVRGAIRDMRDSPKRSTRNLVDMALQFANGRFQNHFFRMAQTMLENEASPYYDLVQDAVNHIDTDRIVTFGMNVGYNSCTYGASKIRAVEDAKGYNVPWTVFLHINEHSNPEKLQDVIAQGEELGIYTWQVFSEGQPERLFPLAKAHPGSAFAIYCSPSDITEAFRESILEHKNVMPVIRYEDSASQACGALRDMGIGYSLYHVYDQRSASEILGGDLFYSTQQLHPLFTALMPAQNCSGNLREKVHRQIQVFRDQQLFQTVPWDVLSDSSWVDSIISSEPCVAEFDANGRLRSISDRIAGELNLFHDDLCHIFQSAFPKAMSFT